MTRSKKDFVALQELLWSEEMFIEPEDSTITMCVCLNQGGLENQAKGNIKPLTYFFNSSRRIEPLH